MEYTGKVRKKIGIWILAVVLIFFFWAESLDALAIDDVGELVFSTDSEDLEHICIEYDIDDYETGSYGHYIWCEPVIEDVSMKVEGFPISNEWYFLNADGLLECSFDLEYHFTIALTEEGKAGLTAGSGFETKLFVTFTYGDGRSFSGVLDIMVTTISPEETEDETESEMEVPIESESVDLGEDGAAYGQNQYHKVEINENIETESFETEYIETEYFETIEKTADDSENAKEDDKIIEIKDSPETKQRSVTTLNKAKYMKIHVEENILKDKETIAFSDDDCVTGFILWIGIGSIFFGVICKILIYRYEIAGKTDDEKI